MRQLTLLKAAESASQPAADRNAVIVTENHAILARDVIYTSRAYATISVSVCLSIFPSVCNGSALAHYS